MLEFPYRPIYWQALLLTYRIGFQSTYTSRHAWESSSSSSKNWFTWHNVNHWRIYHCAMNPPLQNPKYASDVNMPSQTKWRNVGWKTSTFFIQRLQTFFFYFCHVFHVLTFLFFFWEVFFTSMVKRNSCVLTVAYFCVFSVDWLNCSTREWCPVSTLNLVTYLVGW